jgi:hypothetical protein
MLSVMASWLGDLVARRFAKRAADQYADSIKGLLETIKPRGETSEARFRDTAMRALRDVGDIELKREAGVQGAGTRIDIYAHTFDHDFLITIKKGLSEQKIKKVIGEINIVIDRWRPTVPGNKTYVFLYAFGLKDEKELEPLNAFVDFAVRANKQHKGAFWVDFALAGSAGIDDAG